MNAKKILLEYGGVFISDVVGLGKTYVSAMLAGQLDGRTRSEIIEYFGKDLEKQE